MVSGFTKKPLVERLGIKEGFKVAVINPPANYIDNFRRVPRDVSITSELKGSLDLIQFFTRSRKELEDKFPQLRKLISPEGMLWISWRKGSSKVEADLNENTVREIGLKNGLVDVKVSAIDEIWSGLKFVYRLRDRR